MANQNERGVRKLRKGVVVSKMGAKSAFGTYTIFPAISRLSFSIR